MFFRDFYILPTLNITLTVVVISDRHNCAVGGMVGGMINDAMTSAASPVPQTVNPFCENCGAKLDAGTAFCEECGAPVANTGVCKNCGYKFERPGKFCPKCGTKREG